MLLSTLGAIFLGSLLAGKGVKSTVFFLIQPHLLNNF